MINHSALSTTIDVAQLAPKAATAQPRRGDGAFGEALAGAHSVHDRRESREAAAPSRRDQASDARPAERTSGQDRAAQARSERAAERSDRTRETSDDDDAGQAAPTSESDATDTTDATSDGQRSEASDDAAHDDAGMTDADAGDGDGGAEATSDSSSTDAARAATAGTAPAVAAAPVQADLDAIVVPTTKTDATTDAVDAAIRMAIKVDAAATGEPTAATATAEVVDPEAEAKLQAALLRGAEDAQDGDVQAGPTSPSTSRPTSASGPSPVQLAAATFTDADADAAAPTTTQAATATPTQATTQGVAIAAAAATQVAGGEGGDAAAQLVQATVVADEDASQVDADVAAATQLKAGKADAATQAGAAAGDELVEADVPEAVQAARLNQQQGPTVAAAAQQQAAAQAKAAEQAAEEGGESAPPKLEPLPAQASSNAVAAREVAPGIRVREGLLNAHQQQRIDHIAEQLATRLRLSHAAGGSQVQLSLKPRELGEVTVQMQVREGVVAATILVDKADTARTMQASIDDLKRSLEQQGLSIQEFSVDVRGETGAGGANARAAADLNRDAAARGRGSTSSVAGAGAAMPGFDGDDVVSAEDVHDGDVSVLA